jgi:hypothetical protein
MSLTERRDRVMLRFIVAFPMVLHGLAHLGGFFAFWTANRAGFSDRPWLLSKGVTLGSVLGRVLSPLWLLATLGLVGTGVGMVLRQAWWPNVAVGAAALSLAAIVLWWRAVPGGAKAGAVFDVAILVVLLLPWKERIVEWMM